MKYLLLYQWPLRPCRNHLNPNMMLAKNLLWNNLMYVLINSSPSNFFFYDIETISIRGRIKLMSCQHLWQLNDEFIMVSMQELFIPIVMSRFWHKRDIYMYWTCQPVCQSLARPNVVLLSIISWKPFAW